MHGTLGRGTHACCLDVLLSLPSSGYCPPHNISVMPGPCGRSILDLEAAVWSWSHPRDALQMITSSRGCRGCRLLLWCNYFLVIVCSPFLMRTPLFEQPCCMLGLPPSVWREGTHYGPPRRLRQAILSHSPFSVFPGHAEFPSFKSRIWKLRSALSHKGAPLSPWRHSRFTSSLLSAQIEQEPEES